MYDTIYSRPGPLQGGNRAGSQRKGITLDRYGRIKDLYVGERPFLGVLADLLKKGREVRLVHAKEPGPNFRQDFDRYPIAK